MIAGRPAMNETPMARRPGKSSRGRFFRRARYPTRTSVAEREHDRGQQASDEEGADAGAGQKSVNDEGNTRR